MASECIELLRAIADALSEWSADVSKAAQQAASGTPQPARPLDMASDLHELSIWLPAAAGSLLGCMHDLLESNTVDMGLMLDTLGQLVRKVLGFP